MFGSSFRNEAPSALDNGMSGLPGSDIGKAFSAPSLLQSSDMTEDDIAVAQANRMLEFIQVARDFFPAMRDLADHPGWEIMLHIFIGGREGRTVTTADLCERTGTWRPLAVRYVEMLFERGLIERDISADKPDNWALNLTEATEARLRELMCRFSQGFSGPEAAGAAI